MSRYLSAVRYGVIGCAVLIAPLIASAQNYTQTNLISDLSSENPVSVDANLKNAWGVARGASSPWWVNNAGTGTSTLYSGAGTKVPLVVTIPNAAGVSAPSQPTGIVFNGTTDFVVAADGKPAAFIFATKEGTIAGWNLSLVPITMAVTEVDESKQGAVFMGLTWVEVDGQHFLLAANFAGRRIEAFNANFQRVQLRERTFFDPRVPADFAPYNVQAVGDTVVVTYAKQNDTKTAADDNCFFVCGFVDIFTTRGKLVQRLEDGPWMQAPWGVALAPQDFGAFSHDLLIGNRFGGTIAAFNVVTGRFLGNLLDSNSEPIAINGLWGIEFDNRGANEAGTTASPSTGPALFFAAGINNYADGLFGTLTPVPAQLNAEDHE
jgi:uncharacterized protein (TIGR03118 family)